MMALRLLSTETRLYLINASDLLSFCCQGLSRYMLSGSSADGEDHVSRRASHGRKRSIGCGDGPCCFSGSWSQM